MRSPVNQHLALQHLVVQLQVLLVPRRAGSVPSLQSLHPMHSDLNLSRARLGARLKAHSDRRQLLQATVRLVNQVHSVQPRLVHLLAALEPLLPLIQRLVLLRSLKAHLDLLLRQVHSVRHPRLQQTRSVRLMLHLMHSDKARRLQAPLVSPTHLVSPVQVHRLSVGLRRLLRLDSEHLVVVDLVRRSVNLRLDKHHNRAPLVRVVHHQQMHLATSHRALVRPLMHLGSLQPPLLRLVKVHSVKRQHQHLLVLLHRHHRLARLQQHLKQHRQRLASPLHSDSHQYLSNQHLVSSSLYSGTVLVLAPLVCQAPNRNRAM